MMATLQYMGNPMNTALGTRVLRLFGEPSVAQTPDVDMTGKVALVTGGTAGIGRAVAKALAAAGAEVHITGRNSELGAEVAKEIGVTYHKVDHADLANTANFASSFTTKTLGGRPLDVLVNNAAMMFNGYGRTQDGRHERAVALNILGFFALTTALLPAIEAAAHGRVVNVVSAGMVMHTLDVPDVRALDRGDAPWSVPEQYDAIKAYCYSHRSRVLLTSHWAEAQRARKAAGRVEVQFSCTHPGWVETPGLSGAEAMGGFYKVSRWSLRSTEQGADTAVWLAVGLDAADGRAPPNGAYWFDRRVRSINKPLAFTAEAPGVVPDLLAFLNENKA